MKTGRFTLRAALPLLAVGTLLLSACKGGGKDDSAQIQARVDGLLSQMTIEQKASLMMHRSAAIPELGIPEYDWWSEALHGVARNGSATVFPQPIGMAASFDEPLVRKVFDAVSDEARIKNRLAREQGPVKIYQGLSFWTPNINIYRDPRWGRGMETYGEDPYLTGRLGMAVVNGLQGADEPYSIRKLHACAKHYAVHSGPESSRHSYDAVISERDLRETYLPAFKDLVMKSGVEEVMTAYNRFRGVPCGASDYLINTILRGEWGYKGIITSDCGAVNDFYQKGHHEVVSDEASAAAMAVKAGMDTECGDVYRFIPEAVSRGLLSEEDVDRNLSRLLAARIRLGELDGEDPWKDLPDTIVEGKANRALARKMAGESMVLLHNKGGVLPLGKDSGKIALIGPNADDKEMMWGNYNPIPKSTVTLLDAMKERLGADLLYMKACGILSSDMKPEQSGAFAGVSKMTQAQLEALAKKYAVNIADVMRYARREKELLDNFEPALDTKAVLEALKDYDTVIFAGGISPRLEGEEMPVHVPGFSGGDRTSIELPSVQRELLQALHDNGKKVVLVLFSGSAIGLVPETGSCDAILQAWYPGQEGGTAIADVLFGDVNPSGKLPVTFYKNVDDLPDFENYDMEGHTYRYYRGEPLFPFGYGLSYTTFSMSEATASRKAVTFTLTNTGDRPGDEVVQLYVRRNGDTGGPNRTLRAFQRVSLQAGESTKVSIPLDKETFTWWNPDSGKMEPLKGSYTLEVGTSSAPSDLTSIQYNF